MIRELIWDAKLSICVPCKVVPIKKLLTVMRVDYLKLPRLWKNKLPFNFSHPNFLFNTVLAEI